MNRILVIWEYDNTHDNVLTRFHQLLQQKEGRVTVIGYAADEHIKSEAEIRSMASTVLHRSLDDETIISSSSASLESDTVAAAANGNWQLMIKSGCPKRSFFDTDIDAKLLRQLPMPQLICANRKGKSGKGVLATVDLSGDNHLQQAINDQVLKSAAEVATQLHKELHITYIIPINRANYELDLSDPMVLIRKHGSEAIEKLKQLVASHGLESARLHVSAGLPENEIQSLAKITKSDLVVVGSIGRKGLKGLLLGNTVERVIKNLKRDVLIVKPQQTG